MSALRKGKRRGKAPSRGACARRRMRWLLSQLTVPPLQTVMAVWSTTVYLSRAAPEFLDGFGGGRVVTNADGSVSMWSEP